jgi:hypothetical protein
MTVRMPVRESVSWQGTSVRSRETKLCTKRGMKKSNNCIKTVRKQTGSGKMQGNLMNQILFIMKEPKYEKNSENLKEFKML